MTVGDWSTRYPGRAMRVVWVNRDDGTPIQAQAFDTHDASNGTGVEGYYWVPAIGYSTPHVYDDEQTAIEAGRSMLKTSATKAAEALAAFEADHG